MTLAMALSGALCGLGGAILVFGSASHRMVTDGTATGFTGSAGFNGIVAALFGGLHPLWTILSSFVFGGLLVGGTTLQIAVQVPTALIVALNGLVVVFVVSIEYVRRRSRDRLDAAGPLMQVLAASPVKARPRSTGRPLSTPSAGPQRSAPPADPPPASEVELE
jgi:simple sugar transport system permease protein